MSVDQELDQAESFHELAGSLSKDDQVDKIFLKFGAKLAQGTVSLVNKPKNAIISAIGNNSKSQLRTNTLRKGKQYESQSFISEAHSEDSGRLYDLKVNGLFLSPLIPSSQIVPDRGSKSPKHNNSDGDLRVPERNKFLSHLLLPL